MEVGEETLLCRETSETLKWLSSLPILISAGPDNCGGEV